MKTQDVKDAEQRIQSKLGAGIDRLQQYKYFGRLVWVILMLALIGVALIVRGCAG